jgi:hypothetical protein
MELQRYTGAPEPATTDAGLPQPGQRVPTTRTSACRKT